MIVLPLAALMAALWIRAWIDTDDLLAALVGLIFLPAYIIGLLTLKFLYLIPRKCRRIHQQNRGLHQPITVELSEEAYAITTVNGSSRIPWRDFYACKASDAAIALFPSEAQCFILPARVFASASERREIVALIAERVDRFSSS